MSRFFFPCAGITDQELSTRAWRIMSQCKHLIRRYIQCLINWWSFNKIEDSTSSSPFPNLDLEKWNDFEQRRHGSVACLCGKHVEKIWFHSFPPLSKVNWLLHLSAMYSKDPFHLFCKIGNILGKYYDGWKNILCHCWLMKWYHSYLANQEPYIQLQDCSIYANFLPFKLQHAKLLMPIDRAENSMRPLANSNCTLDLKPEGSGSISEFLMQFPCHIKSTFNKRALPAVPFPDKVPNSPLFVHFSAGHPFNFIQEKYR